MAAPSGGDEGPERLPASLAGTTIHHAFLVLENASEVVFASDAAPLLLTR